MKNTTNTSNGSTGKWKERLIDYVDSKIKNNERIQSFYKQKKFNCKPTGIHLAVFTEPFLSLLLEGSKTVESRFGLNKAAPFQKVQSGDIVFVKKSGGDVVAYFLVGETEYHYCPSHSNLEHVKKKYSQALGAHSVENFWENRKDARYISFFEVVLTKEIPPIKIEKKDRRAWLVLQPSVANEITELWKK